LKHEHAELTIGLSTLEQRLAVTFDADKNSRCPFFTPILPESENVISGAVMPVRYLSPRGAAWGALSLDSDDMKHDEWRPEHLLVLARAAKKLEFIGRDNCIRDEAIYDAGDWKEAINLFLEKLRRDRLDVAVCNLLQQSTQQPIEDWKGDHKQVLDDADAPLRMLHEDSTAQWNDKGRFRLKLYYGPFETGLLLDGRFAQMPECGGSKHGLALAEEWVATRLVAISQHWSRFVDAKVGTGVPPLFSVSFVEGALNRGMRTWRHQLKIAPEVFSGTAMAGMQAHAYPGCSLTH